MTRERGGIDQGSTRERVCALTNQYRWSIVIERLFGHTDHPYYPIERPFGPIEQTPNPLAHTPGRPASHTLCPSN